MSGVVTRPSDQLAFFTKNSTKLVWNNKEILSGTDRDCWLRCLDFGMLSLTRWAKVRWRQVKAPQFPDPPSCFTKTAPPPCFCLNASPISVAYRTQGVVERYRAISNNLDESESEVWQSSAWAQSEEASHELRSNSSIWEQQRVSEELNKQTGRRSAFLLQLLSPHTALTTLLVHICAFPFLSSHC